MSPGRAALGLRLRFPTNVVVGEFENSVLFEQPDNNIRNFILKVLQKVGQMLADLFRREISAQCRYAGRGSVSRC